MNLWEAVETIKGQSSVSTESSSLQKKEQSGEHVHHSVFAGTMTPYLKDNCELIIPLDCQEKYRWWAGGQSIFETLIELNAPDNVFEKYIGSVTSSCSWRQLQEIRKTSERPG